MRNRKVVTALVAVFVSFLLALPAFASNARIVRLSYVDGSVSIDRNTGVGLEQAIVNMPITQGTRLVSDNANDRVEVEFENGSTLRLAGPGEIVFRDMALTSAGDKVSLIEVTRGLVYFDIRLKGNDDFRVTANNESFALPRTSHFRLDVTDDRTEVAVFKGEVKLEGSADDVSVGKGDTLTLNVDSPGKYELAKNIMPDDLDAWDKQRQQYRDQYANSDAYKYSNSRYGGPYSYGMSDMAYYGGYSMVPGYGWMWRPYGFDASWDPFGYGAWSFYPGSGWVFISQYPWGWTPYRYGSWVFVSGGGWYWRPGGNYYNWYSSPVIYNRPLGFVPPTPPNRNYGPTVVLGPGRRPVDNPVRRGPGGVPIPPRVGEGQGRGTPTGRTGVTPGNRQGTVPPILHPAQPIVRTDGVTPRQSPRATPNMPQQPSPRSEPRVTSPSQPSPRMNPAPAPRPSEPSPRMNREPAPRTEAPPSPHFQSSPRVSQPQMRMSAPSMRMSAPSMGRVGGGGGRPSAPSGGGRGRK